MLETKIINLGSRDIEDLKSSSDKSVSWWDLGSEGSLSISTKEKIKWSSHGSEISDKKNRLITGVVTMEE